MNDTASPRARLLRLLLSAIGASAAAPGCGGNVVVDGSGGSGGTTTVTTGTTTITTGTTTITTGTTTVTTGTTTTGTTTTGTTTGTVNCKDFLATSTQTQPEQTCAAGSGAFAANINCFKPPFGPGTCASSLSEQCILDTYSCGFSSGGWEIACGPLYEPTGLCCYVITGDCAVGRPFTIDGRARLGALIAADDGWAAGLAPDVASLAADTRAALADAWGREALFEHASIASFARFVMELLAVGAPSDLVADAQRALADEHEHARLCLGLASAYEGRSLGFGPLSIDGALAGSCDVAAIAASLASEGCIAETAAALQVAIARDEARDPVVKAALARIAEDEATHAALAWRALAFLLDTRGPEVRGAVEAAFAEAETHVSIGAITDREGDATALRAHGYLPAEERRTLAREALGRVIGPAALALLHPRTPRRAAKAAVHA